MLRYHPESKLDREKLQALRRLQYPNLTMIEARLPEYLRKLVSTSKICSEKRSFHLISAAHLRHLLRCTESDVPAVNPRSGSNLAVFTHGDRSTNFHMKWKLQQYRSNFVRGWLTHHAKENLLRRCLNEADLSDWVGKLVAAEWVVDGKWYRAYLVSLMEGKATMYYIDEGYEEIQSIDTLRLLPEELQNILPMAFRCRLAHVDIKDDDEAMEQGEAQLYFISRMKSTVEFACKIISISDEDTILKEKADVILHDSEILNHSGSEDDFESVNMWVREKLAWRSRKIMYQDHVLFPDEIELLQEQELVTDATVAERELIWNRPSSYKIVYGVSPHIVYIQHAEPNVEKVDSANDRKLQEFYNECLWEHPNCRIRTTRVIQKRYYVWRERDGSSGKWKWSRVRVVRTNLAPGKCFVFRIDHGDHRVVDVKDMMEMRTEFYKWPCRVAKAHLAHINPSEDTGWESISTAFQELLNQRLTYWGLPLSRKILQPKGSGLYDGFSYEMILIDREFGGGMSLQARIALLGDVCGGGPSSGSADLMYFDGIAVPKYCRSDMIAEIRSDKNVTGIDSETLNISKFSEISSEVGRSVLDELPNNFDKTHLSADWTIFRGDPSIQPRYEQRGKFEIDRCKCGRSCGIDCPLAWQNKRMRTPTMRKSYRYLKFVGHSPAQTKSEPGPFTKLFGKYLGAVKISHVVGGGVFYMQKAGDVDKLESMMNDLGRITCHLKLFPDKNPVGYIVAAEISTEHHGKKWYRAYVYRLIRKSQTLKVILIDFGSTTNLKLSDIRVLPKYFLRVPPFCRRAHLDVSSNCLRNNKWTTQLNDLFVSYVNLNPDTIYLAWNPRPNQANVVEVMDYDQDLWYDTKTRSWWNGGQLIDFPVIIQDEYDKGILRHLIHSVGVNLCYEVTSASHKSYEFESVEKIFL